jgi:hypothetical protein
MRRIVFGALLLAACGEQDTTTAPPLALAAECTRDLASAPADAWICGEDRTLECDTHDGADIASIYVVEPRTELSCFASDYSVSDPGPFPAGEHTIVVTRLSNNETCTSELHVEDTIAPAVQSRELTLWPPNHKFHTISADDCAPATDVCDDDVSVEFTYAASDEPVNANGDGNSEPDIVFSDCGNVEIRSERQGGSNGRVYTFGWRAADDAGNETVGECWVTVVHDQSGRESIDDGENYRIDAPAGCGGDENNNNNPGDL